MHQSETAFSIICCIKNGTRFLKNLQNLIQQKNKAELLIVEDFSSDETKEKLQELNQSDFRLIYADIDRPGKKSALSQGIKASRCNKLVLTDIDCEPASKSWASIMAAQLNESTQIVLGYAPYKIYPGILNKYIRFETLMTAVQYMSYALRSIPYMGVGRNLAYTKQIFEDANGFASHNHIASGDDDLFISQVASADNTAVCLEPATFCYSEPARSFKDYFNQKRRHISTAVHYKFIHQILLALFAISGIAFYIVLSVCLFLDLQEFALWVYLSFLFPTWLMFYGFCEKYAERNLFLWYPILDLGYFVFISLLSPFLFIKKKKW